MYSSYMFPFTDDINKLTKTKHKQSIIPPDLMSFFREEMKSHKSSGFVPNTEGSDYFFTIHFITPEMEWDFDRIEDDFMKHCYDKLRDFGQVYWYGHNTARYSNPSESHRSMVIGLMLNGAKSGDEYCRALIQYLFKIYHKKLYKQLKRFSKISVNEIMSLCVIDNNTDMDMGCLAIILTMCSINGIILSDNCSVLFHYLDVDMQECEKADEEAVEFLEFADGLFEECQQQVEEWMAEDKRLHPNLQRQCKVYWKDDAFVSGCLRNQGYPEDYIIKCEDNYMGMSIQFSRTLAVLRTVFPKREFTFEEVQHYCHIYSAVSALGTVSEEFDNINSLFLGQKYEYDSWDDETLFHPENVVVHAATKKDKEQKTLTNVVSLEIGDANKEDLLAEIDELRRKLNHREMEYNRLKVQYSAVHVEKKEAESLLAKYQNDREELLALREFVYKLENDTPEFSETSIDDMRKVIADKPYAIIGGHVNWINKLKTEFPKWTFVLPSSYKNVDADALANHDMIFFFTDHISHAAYGKCIAIARERKIPFSYLHGVNIEQIIRQIYDSEKSGKK